MRALGAGGEYPVVLDLGIAFERNQGGGVAQRRLVGLAHVVLDDGGARPGDASMMTRG